MNYVLRSGPLGPDRHRRAVPLGREGHRRGAGQDRPRPGQERAGQSDRRSSGPGSTSSSGWRTPRTRRSTSSSRTRSEPKIDGRYRRRRIPAQPRRPLSPGGAGDPLAAVLLRRADRSPSARPRSRSEGAPWYDGFARAFTAYGAPLLPLVPVRADARRCSAIALGYPLAYVIAFRSGRFKNLLLGLVILPFFTTFLVRTFAWKTILNDGGPAVWLLTRLHRPAGGGPPAQHHRSR